MINLVDLYTEFLRIDQDALGGYARVAEVSAGQKDGSAIHRAFKLMRHELIDKQVGMQRFENELRVLLKITNDKKAPTAITKILDSGFAPTDLSLVLQNMHPNEKLSPNLRIISTGKSIQKFLKQPYWIRIPINGYHIWLWSLHPLMTVCCAKSIPKRQMRILIFTGYL